MTEFRGMSTAFHIKVRKVGAKRWSFVSSNGAMNYLRVHALQFADEARALAFITANAPNNPGYDWKVQALEPSAVLGKEAA